jgi:endonuclease/exonuclease/phosphatase family metal-dependent hydrolase
MVSGNLKHHYQRTFLGSLARWVSVFLALSSFCQADDQASVRFATFNASLNRESAGALIADLESGGNLQARRVAEVIQRVRPDVLLLNEFDYDDAGRAAELFQKNYLAVGQRDQAPIDFEHRFAAEVNTGVPSGIDLDRNALADEPNDAFGFGRFPGQFGMVVFSRLPIDPDSVRTFRTFLWKNMPRARLPIDLALGKPYYSPATLKIFRLSSKSFWAIPLGIDGATIEFLASHPTPPVFDGPEDRNGCRNHDEIRLLADYIDPARGDYLVDDQGRPGGIQRDRHFVIAGDLNADPHDGDSHNHAARLLVEHPLINHDSTPASRGAADPREQRAAANATQQGNPAHDTANFGRVGNLRVDYVLPSKTLAIIGSGVFWPTADEREHDLLRASDHGLVWVDVRLKP